MPGPAPRPNDTDALVALLVLQSQAEYAEARVWRQASIDIRARRYTAKAAAATLRCSEAKLYRQFQSWNAHIDAGNGVGA
jgi:hypothetical protein